MNENESSNESVVEKARNQRLLAEIHRLKMEVDALIHERDDLCGALAAMECAVRAVESVAREREDETRKVRAEAKAREELLQANLMLRMSENLRWEKINESLLNTLREEGAFSSMDMSSELHRFIKNHEELKAEIENSAESKRNLLAAMMETGSELPIEVPEENPEANKGPQPIWVGEALKF